MRAASLTPIYGKALQSLGLRLTPRNGLIDRSDGGYENSPRGTHLAIYVEPLGDYTTEQYVQGIVDVTKVFVPDVFDRWPGLESMDVCQEPTGADGQLDDPPPVTQIEFTRAQAEAIDWDTVTLTDLIVGADDEQLRLHVSEAIEDSGAYRRASES